MFLTKKADGALEEVEESDLLVAVNEEGEDEEEADEEEADETEGEDAESGGEGGDGSAEGEQDGGSGAKETHVPFANLDLTGATCFGWCPLAKGRQSWFRLADQSVTKGWKATDVQRIGDDLMKNVDACYFFVAQGDFLDIDSGMKYHARFVNDSALWYLSIPDSEEAEILPEQADQFFKSELFGKFARRCGELIDRAVRCYYEIIEPHMQNGEFLQVSEVKLARILHDCGVSRFMSNLRDCKYGLK